MRNIGTKAAFAAFVTGGLLALGAELRAGGSIDTSGATIQTGSASSPGTVTTDEAASLGAVPSVESLFDPYVDSYDTGDPEDSLWSYFFDPGDRDAWDPYVFPGLGGPDFHARTDLTMPAGTHDYGTLTVDAGVTVTIPGGSDIRVAGDARIEGRIEIASGTLEFGSDVTIQGHAGEVVSGIHTKDEYSSGQVLLTGRLTVDADEGAQVEIGAYARPKDYYGSGFTLTSYGHVRSKVARAKLTNLVVRQAGDLDLKDCSGGSVDFDCAKGRSLLITGGSFHTVGMTIGGDLTVTDATIPDFYPTVGGSIRLAESATFVNAGFEAYGDVVIEDDVTVSGADFWVTSYRGKVALGSGVATDIGTAQGGGLHVSGWTGVTIAGSYKGNAHEIYAPRGDILFRDGTVITAAAGTGSLNPMTLMAQGAIATTGGTMDLTASEFNIRSVTGDLDIDVSTMTATTGKIVVLSNGAVRLRGAYSAAQEIQILSRKDKIDVSGATIRTDDAGAGLSGFVRLATYASTATIDASDATLRTGSADGQSGDILLQIAKSGEETATGMLKVAATTTRRTKQGVVTLVRGTVSSPRRNLTLAASNRIDAGSRTHHVFLRGKSGRLTGRADRAELVVTQSGSRRANFDLTLRDGGGTPGTTVALAFERAGFRASGKFKRPKSK